MFYNHYTKKEINKQYWRVAYTIKTNNTIFYTHYTPKDIEGWLNAIRMNKLERIINE